VGDDLTPGPAENVPDADDAEAVDAQGEGSLPARAVAVAAAVLVLLVGLAAFAAARHDHGDSGGRALGAAGPTASRSAPPVRSVNWSRVHHPLDCGSLPTRVLDVHVSDLTGDGHPEAVVLLRCDAGAGSPPSTIFVYDRASLTATPARPVATLLASSEDVLLNTITVRGRAVTGEAYAYSRPGMPRCCPDRHLRLSWHWTGGGFARTTRSIGG